MRRIEARISSIEGSWTFAVWLIPVFPTAAFAPYPSIRPTGIGASESSLESLLYASGM
jgi:hypothetical protein